MSIIPATPVALTSPSQVAKAILYIALTVLAIFQQAQGHVTLPIILAMVVAVLGAIPVYFAVGTKLKTVIAFALAVVQGLVIIVGTTLTGADLLRLPATVWIGLVISGLAAIGIAIVPNKPLIDARGTNNVTSFV
jgi:hypothetical protein